MSFTAAPPCKKEVLPYNMIAVSDDAFLILAGQQIAITIRGCSATFGSSVSDYRSAGDEIDDLT